MDSLVIKPLVGLIMFGTAFIVARRVYNRTKLKPQKWKYPIQWALIAWSIVIYIWMLIINLLDKIGLYPD